MCNRLFLVLIFYILLPLGNTAYTEEVSRATEGKKFSSDLFRSVTAIPNDAAQTGSPATPPPLPVMPKKIKAEDIPDELKTPEQMDEGQSHLYL
jgi:hypothetical protein